MPVRARISRLGHVILRDTRGDTGSQLETRSRELALPPVL